MALLDLSTYGDPAPDNAEGQVPLPRVRPSTPVQSKAATPPTPRLRPGDESTPSAPPLPRTARGLDLSSYGTPAPEVSAMMSQKTGLQPMPRETPDWRSPRPEPITPQNPMEVSRPIAEGRATRARPNVAPEGPTQVAGQDPRQDFLSRAGRMVDAAVAATQEGGPIGVDPGGPTDRFLNHIGQTDPSLGGAITNLGIAGYRATVTFLDGFSRAVFQGVPAAAGQAGYDFMIGIGRPQGEAEQFRTDIGEAAQKHIMESGMKPTGQLPPGVGSDVPGFLKTAAEHPPQGPEMGPRSPTGGYATAMGRPALPPPGGGIPEAGAAAAESPKPASSPVSRPQAPPPEAAPSPPEQVSAEPAPRPNVTGGIHLTDNGTTASLFDIKNNSNLSLSVKPDGIYVGIVEVPPVSRGRGLAIRLYERAVEYAASKGLPLRSDASVTADAARIYEALGQRGYDVRTDQGVTRKPDGSYSAFGSKNGYVFEVRPKAATPPETPTPPPETINVPPDKPAAAAPVAPATPTEAPAPSTDLPGSRGDLELSKLRPASAPPAGDASPPPVIAMPGPKGEAPAAPAPPQSEASAAQSNVENWHATGGEPHPVAEPARVQELAQHPDVNARLQQRFGLDQAHDIPYLAGYSQDGKTIFFDKDLPPTIQLGGKPVDPRPFLATHEHWEKSLIDALGYTYQGAHEVATGAEHAALRAAGYDPAEYEAALKPFIKDDQHKQLTNVPPTIDMTPYNDTQAGNIKARMAKAEGAPSASGAEPVKSNGTIAPESKVSGGADLSAYGHEPGSPAVEAIAPKATESATPSAEVKPTATGFKTEKGSVYQIHEGGTTTRTKSSHVDVGHEATDVGVKKRSVKTIYLDTTGAGLSTAGIQGGVKSRVVLKGGKAGLVTWNEQAGRWGVPGGTKDNPLTWAVPYHEEPAVGRYPLELWQPRTDQRGYDAFAGMHAGNKIVSMDTAASEAKAPQKIASAPEPPKAPEAAPKTEAKPAPKPAPAKAQNLVSFLKDHGGIQGKGLSADIRRQYPGLINNKTGMNHDLARELASEAGYLDHIYGTPEKAMAESTPGDLHDMLADEPHKAYPHADQAIVAEKAAAKKQALAKETAQREIEATLAEGGSKNPPADLIDRATTIRLNTGVDPETAIERAISAIGDETLTEAQAQELTSELPPGWESDAEPVEPPQSRERAPANGGRAQEPAQRGGPEEARGAAPDRGKTAVETTEAGKQGIIRGTEKLTPEQVAAAKGAEKASKAQDLAAVRAQQSKMRKGDQIPADEQKGGLFEAKTGDLLERPRLQESANEYEAKAESTPYKYVDLGPFEWQRGPAGAQLQDYILANGREHGVEFFVAVGKDGKALSNGYGLRNSVGASDEFYRAIADPKNEIIVHHNHPMNKGLSAADLGLLASPGMKAIWAHGHGGFVGRAELTKVAQARMQGSLQDRDRTIQLLYQLAADRIHDAVTNVSPQDPAIEDHIISSILRDAGVLDYRSSFDAVPEQRAREAAYIERAGLRPHMLAAAREIREVIFDDRRVNPAAAALRQSADLRSPGDVGAVFDRSREPPQRDAIQRWNAQARSRNAEAQAETGFGRRPAVREEGDVPREEYNDLLRRAVNGEETPPLTRAQASERKRAEKEFPFKQRMLLDKTTRELAARAEEVAQMGKRFLQAARAAHIAQGRTGKALTFTKGQQRRADAKIFALHQKITKYQENVNHPENQPTLTAAERKLYDEHYKPLFDLHKQIYTDVIALKHLMDDEQRAAFEDMLDPEYVHHVVIGKGSKYDRIANEVGYGPIMGSRTGTGARSLPVSASAAKESTFYALQNDRTGKRVIVSQGPHGLTRWENKKPVSGKGSLPAGVDLKIGKTFTTKAGDPWTVQRAKLDEKMKHAPVDYYQNAYATTADSVLALEHAKLGLQYFDQLTKTPQWQRMATKDTSLGRERGWKQIDRAPLGSWYLAPELYEPLIDFYGGEPILNLAGARTGAPAPLPAGVRPGLLKRIARPLGQTLEGVNRIATASIFISPFPHAWNVANHWAIERGWDWASIPGYARLLWTGAQAAYHVSTRSPRYVGMMRDGAPMFYANARNNNLIQHIFDRTGAEMEAEKPGGFWHQVAKAFNYPSPAAIVPFFYKEVSRAMWHMGDTMMMQRILELENKFRVGSPLSQEAAINRARQHIPDYVVPPKVAGSRFLSRILQDMMFTMFGRYRYSQYRGFFHDANKAIHLNHPMDAGAAIGRLLVTWVAATTIYDALDQYLQKLIGIPDAKVVRGGPFHIIENLKKLKEEGIYGTPRFLFTTFIPSPVVTAALQLVTNHELWKEAFGYRDQPIIQPGDTVPEGVKHEATAAASALGIASDINRIMQGQLGPVVGQQLGVKLPYNRPVR